MRGSRRSKARFLAPLLLAGVCFLAGFLWGLRAGSPPPAPHSGRIAIVLDDWGYSLGQVPALRAIRRPLTVAVLPGLPYSVKVASMSRRHGHEVILHMPMEAMDPSVPQEEGTLKTGMSDAEIVTRLSRALATVPGASGISNHQGSRATADARFMETVLQESRRRGLFFLDSFVTDDSICREAARRTGVRIAQRDIFLDNELTPAAIRKQVALLARTAAQRGYAVGIGHDRPVTLQLLQEAVPALEEAGFRLVPVSELVEKER